MAVAGAQSVKRQAESALEERLRELGVELDADGRAAHVREVVVETIDEAALGQAAADLREGSGGELTATQLHRPKFHSAFSSCALAVNVFGPWRLDPSDLPLDGRSDYTSLCFEAQRPIFRSRATPPNLDVLLKTEDQVVAIESKATEYLAGNERASFTGRYQEAVEELADESWKRVYELLLREPEHYVFLNADQLVKHYLGLKRAQQKDPRPITLTYAYWEPADADAHATFARHRAEIDDLSERVGDRTLRFHAISYRDLWRDWEATSPRPAEHVQRLRERYDVSLAVNGVGADPT